MQPNMAQVLNTLAHEIRTPLAVSQGYLKLYLDGRLTTPEDQRRALQQTREALGVIATLCVDMTKVSTLAEAPEPPLMGRIDVTAFLEDLRGATQLKGSSWDGGAPAGGWIATNGARDLERAVGVMAKAAFDEARESPRAVHIAGDGQSLTLLAGAQEVMAAVQSAAEGPNAGPVDVGRGGKGLSLIWASFVLRQHRVQTWNHQDHRASIGFRFPLVQV